MGTTSLFLGITLALFAFASALHPYCSQSFAGQKTNWGVILTSVLVPPGTTALSIPDIACDQYNMYQVGISSRTCSSLEPAATSYCVDLDTLVVTSQNSDAKVHTTVYCAPHGLSAVAPVISNHSRRDASAGSGTATNQFNP